MTGEPARIAAWAEPWEAYLVNARRMHLTYAFDWGDFRDDYEGGIPH